MKFSVLVLTYNSTLEKIIVTLESIIRQDITDFEIIVSDDGSKTTYYHEIEQYFMENNFCNYTILNNSKNVGTVQNLLRALECSSGEFIKGIGAGDLLFESTTLSQIYTQMKDKNAKIAYGLLRSFRFVDSNFNSEYTDFQSPRELLDYNKMNKNQILYKTLIKSDWISGATLFFERNYLKTKLNEIKDYVIYCEDLIQLLAHIENVEIQFLNLFVIWYEFGDGISTSSTMSLRLSNDHLSFFKYIKAVRKCRYIGKAILNVRINRIKLSLIRQFIFYIINFHLLVLKLTKKSKVEMNLPLNMGAGFLCFSDFRLSVIKRWL